MLQAIKQFFTDNIDPDGAPLHHGADHRLKVATAALLIEMMRMDNETTEQERQTVLSALRTKFDLTTEETHDLLELAEAEASEAIDYHQFTSLIKRSFSREQKEKVVEYLWLVAMSDNHVDPHEEYLVRKISGLVGLPHEAFIAAKHRARGGGSLG